MNLDLKNRVALIAASSQGIGLATAEEFAAEGCRVAMCSRNRKTLEAAAEKIRNQHNAEVYADALLAASLEDWQGAIDANFLSTVYFAREVIPRMQRKHWGRIITITSITTKQPVADLVLSNAVRAAVVGLVKSLANEFGKDGILVNNVGPGFTTTDRLKELARSRSAASGKSQQEIHDAWAADTSVKRLGEPREVAQTIVWLASDRASYVTGQTILVDGGVYKGL
jgi:3-oxoacyl-[acyl-carrier protein] reductase